MPPRKWHLRIRDILASIERIIEYTINLDFEQFRSDTKTFDAVVRNFEIIGEAAPPGRGRRTLDNADRIFPSCKPLISPYSSFIFCAFCAFLRLHQTYFAILFMQLRGKLVTLSCVGPRI